MLKSIRNFLLRRKKVLTIKLNSEEKDTLYYALLDQVRAYEKDLHRNNNSLEREDFSIYSEEMLLDENEFLTLELNKTKELLSKIFE